MGPIVLSLVAGLVGKALVGFVVDTARQVSGQGSATTTLAPSAPQSFQAHLDRTRSPGVVPPASPPPPAAPADPPAALPAAVAGGRSVEDVAAAYRRADSFQAV